MAAVFSVQFSVFSKPGIQRIRLLTARLPGVEDCGAIQRPQRRQAAERIYSAAMESLPTPHNNFFHFALSHLPNARSLIETQLDAQALRELKLDTLRLETGSFIDPDLRERFSDLLFSVDLANPTGKNQSQTHIYLLFEHKSQSDATTVLQLLSYIVRILERRLRDGQRLCPIIPLVVYHGEGRWTAARKLADLIAAPDALAAYQINFEFPLLDLNHLADEQIEGEAVLRSSLRLLKYSRSSELTEHLADILTVLRQSLLSVQVKNWITAIGVYVMAVNKSIDDQQYKQTVASVFPTQFEPGSLADRLLIRGRNEGRQQGIEQGLEQGLEQGREQGIEQGLEQGREQGIEQGIEQGRDEGRKTALIETVRMLEDLLGVSVTPKEALTTHSLDALTTTIARLQQQLRDRRK